MPTPTQTLKNIRLVIAGDIRAWMTKVRTLVDEGADIHVLDNYKGDGSIVKAYMVKAYMISGADVDNVLDVSRFLFGMGVRATPELFVDALLTNVRFADVVMKASNNSINVNTLAIYGESSDDWVLRNTILKKHSDAIKYLISSGLRTSTKNISLDDIIRISSKNFPR